MTIADYPIDDGFEDVEAELSDWERTGKRKAFVNHSDGDSIANKLNKVQKRLDEVNRKLDIILSALGYK